MIIKYTSMSRVWRVMLTNCLIVLKANDLQLCSPTYAYYTTVVDNIVNEDFCQFFYIPNKHFWPSALSFETTNCFKTNVNSTVISKLKSSISYQDLEGPSPVLLL